MYIIVYIKVRQGQEPREEHNMKMIEISYRAGANELIKLNTRLERAQKALEKKQAKAEKLGVADMTREQHIEWLKDVETTDMGWIVNKKDQQMNGAWYDLYSAQREVEDIQRQIENAEKRFAKAEEKVEALRKEEEMIADLKAKEELMKKRFEEEVKEWAKDGITLEDRYDGRTPKGKKFWIYINNGWTKRSMHCYTLRIENETIFTSGEFWRAYAIVKNS